MRNIEQPIKIAMFAMITMLCMVASMQIAAALETGINGRNSIDLDLSSKSNISYDSTQVSAEENSDIESITNVKLQEVSLDNQINTNVKNKAQTDATVRTQGGDEDQSIGFFVVIGDKLKDIREIIVNMIVRFKADETVTVNETNPANNTNVTLPVEQNQTGNNNSETSNTNTTLPINNTNSTALENSTNVTLPNNETNSTIEDGTELNSSLVTGISVSIDRGIGWAINDEGIGSLIRFGGTDHYFEYSDDSYTDASLDMGQSGLGILEFKDTKYKLKLNPTNNPIEISKKFDIIGDSGADEGDLILNKTFSAGNFGTWTGTFVSTSTGANYTIGLMMIERSIKVSTENEARMTSANTLDVQGRNAEFQAEFNRIAEAQIEIGE